MSMKIMRLYVKDLKRIQEVEIRPDGDVVILAGANDQGKTSILDAIQYLFGGKRLIPRDPIRHGADNATVIADLENGYTITQRYTGKNIRLEVATAEGAKVPSPATFLAERSGDLSFDPFAFTRLAGKDRRARLLAACDIGLDLDEHAEKVAAAMESRRDIGRDVRNLEAELKGMAVPAPDAPTEEVSVAEASRRLQEEIAKKQASEQYDRDLADSAKAINEAKAEADRLEAEWFEAKDRLDEAEKSRLKLVGLTMETPRIEEAQAALDAIDETNRAARGVKAYREKAAALQAKRDEHDSAQAHLDNLREIKERALAAADLPVSGLGVDDDDLTHDGVPFVQLSTSKRLRISTQIAMALSPEPGVILVRDANCLDPENKQAVIDAAMAGDCQVWFEEVDTSGKVGIVIEDGMVAKVNAAGGEGGDV